MESYEYDDQGRRTRGQTAIDDGTVYEKWQYEFKDDYLAKKTHRNSKDVLEEYWEYDEYGNELITAYYHDGQVSSYYVREYKGQGRTLKSTEYGDEGHTVKSITEYESYEDKYSGTREAKKTYYTEGGDPDGYSVYEYDGQVPYRNTAEVKYDKDDKLVERREIEYNSAGSGRKETVYDASGKLLSAYESLYDEAGRYAGSVSYGEGGKEDSRYEYVYDDQGNQVRSNYYDENHRLTSHTESDYDVYGNEIYQAYYDQEGKVTSRYWYEYDSAGHRRKSTRESSYNDSKEVTEYDVDGDEIP